jgi:hypothetical protein
MILGKSNHPIEVKRISIKAWGLRDEIEQALANLHANKDENFDKNLAQLKEFYQRLPQDPTELSSAAKEDSGELVPEVGEVDEDMAAMAAALDEDAEDEEAKEGDEAADQADKDAAIDSNASADGAAQEKTQVNIARTLPLGDKVSNGFIFLSDINMDEILFFSKHGFTYGQSVVIEFLIPKKFTLSTEIVTCQQYAVNSKIISETKPNFRVQAKFSFIHPRERTYLRDFLKSVEPDIPPPPKKAPKTDEDDDDDDLSDFGF